MYVLNDKMAKIRLKTDYEKGAPFGTAQIIGSASWGPMDTIQKLRKNTDVTSMFVSGNLVTGATKFFNYQGREIQLTRIGDGNQVKATEVLLYDIGVSDTTVLTATALYYGTHGNSIDVTVTVNGANRDIEITDGVTTETYDNGGSGYATNQAIADAINGTSNLITLTVASGKETIELVDGGPQTIDLSTGADGGTGIAAVDPIFVKAHYFD